MLRDELVQFGILKLFSCFVVQKYLFPQWPMLEILTGYLKALHCQFNSNDIIHILKEHYLVLLRHGLRISS